MSGTAPLAPSSALPAGAAAPPRPPWYHWRRWGLNFLTISILAHLLFGTGATYLIVQSFQAKRKQTFAGAPSAPNAPQRALEHHVQLQKKQQTMSAPAPVKRITTTSNSKVALPAMPAMPHMDSAVQPLAMAGMGGTGVSMGTGTGGAGGSGGGGGGLSLFGVRSAGAANLEGTFYDYKMDQGYQVFKGDARPDFAKIVKDVLPINGPWHPEQPFRHFTGPVKLHSHFFIFPAIFDTEAGKAFQSPRSGPGSWLAVYRGTFSAPTSGSFRFVAFGDNVMMVQIDDHMVLDGSDKGYTGLKREGHGNIAFPKKGGTPLFAGEWFSLDAGVTKKISVAVGDEGGIFCSGLFIQPRNVTYAAGPRGVPKLSVFMIGEPSPDERKLLGDALSPDCLHGPFFLPGAAPVTDSIFSH